MKVRDSGMSEEEMWNSFFNPQEVLRKLGLNEEVKDVVEFGSGYGTFSIPASKIINGYLYAIDIEPNLMKHIVLLYIRINSILERAFLTIISPYT